MAQTLDDTLEARLGELETGLRALRTANPFGQITAVDLALVELWGTPSTVGSVGWVSGTPLVSLYVASGRLRVDVAASQVASGNKCSVYTSYAVLGPAATAALSLTAAQVVAPAYDRSYEVQHSGTGQDARGAASTFGLHTGLAPGWYTVAARYALTYSSTAVAPYGGITNRRLSAMPY
jgi:hypothetical protein